MAGILRTILRDPGLPERYRDPANWPAPMRREYGDDGGTASAAGHREWLVRRFRHCRTLLDDFRPEGVVIWGDDQYENFTDDVLPPFCVLAYVAFQVNCYGRRVIAQRGYRSNLARPVAEADLDPPSPTPKRCMEVGAATARAMRESPWRTALIASSSWSHAFLTDKHHQLYPDIEADRRLYEALRVGDYETWRKTPLASIEESGQQERLNWYMLAGAMEELGRKPDACDFVETASFNSNKCFALFQP